VGWWITVVLNFTTQESIYGEVPPPAPKVSAHKNRNDTPMKNKGGQDENPNLPILHNEVNRFAAEAPQLII
jgi:hypothetical protein